MCRALFSLCLFLAVGFSLATGENWRAPSKSEIDAVYPQLAALYQELHRNPELSLHEQKTAAKIAEQLRGLGFTVATGVGGNGVVGVLKNGEGSTVMIRAELDALPVPEKTDLTYASHVMAKDDSGSVVPVMHACGHDLHMAIGIGTATLLAHNQDRWHGTFIYVGQPAEERGMGAKPMLEDGLWTRFPRPDYAIAVHDTSNLPAGKVSYTPGYALANVSTVDVTIYGKGGHGAAPERAIDPIVIAARTILGWQTIISRENSPLDPGVITVGSIHAGTKSNIIPDEAHMQLTVRSYKPEVHKHLLEAIERIAKAEAQAAGAPKPPKVEVSETGFSVYNDPALTQRIAKTLKQVLGDTNVMEAPPVMAADDFAEYGHAGVPALLFSIGAVNPFRFEAAQKNGEILPSPHSPFFAPDLEPSLRTGIEAEAAAVLELLGSKAAVATR